MLLSSFEHKFPQNIKAVLNRLLIENEKLKRYVEIKTLKRRPLEYGKFFFSSHDIEGIVTIIKSLHPHSFSETIARADRAKNHDFEIFGKEIHFNGDIDWFFEPLSGKRWSDQYTKWIDCRGTDRIGDVLGTWTFNTHYHFYDLGKAYWFTGDETYAEEIIAQVMSWRKQNPYMRGINWESSLIISLRCISWIFAFFFIQESRIFRQKGRDCLLMGILEGAHHVSRNISNHGYNHLIGEACFITIAGVLFPFFHKAHEWKNMGMRILIAEADRQFYEDGGHKEQSFGYHKFVVDLYLMVYILANKNGLNVPELLSRKVEKALEFLVNTVKPDGTWPDMGDNSEIQAHFITGRSDLKDARCSIAMGSVLFNRPEFKHVAGDETESLLWMLGLDQFKIYVSMKPDRKINSSVILDKSGYFVMRSEQDNKYFIFDYGQQGIGLSAHGHADLFSFELFADNTSFIVDSGTFTYNGDRKWRDYFRSTATHNSVAVNGESQAVITGTFSWGKMPSITLHSSYTSEKCDVIEVSHDGYTRLANSAIHTRKIIFRKPDFWIIDDLVAGTGRHSIEQGFRMLQECHIYDDSLIVRSLIKGGTNIALVPLDTIELSLKMDRGWISPSYNSKEEIAHIRYTKSNTLPIRFKLGIFTYKNENEFKENLKKMHAFNAAGSLSIKQGSCV